MAKQVKNEAAQTVEQDATTLVVEHGALMSSIEKAQAEKDAKLYLSAKTQRKALVQAFRAAGRTSKDWETPESEDCAAFYKELKALSRKACESGRSIAGLNEAELIQFPTGYLIATVIDKDVKSAQLPDWATEEKRHHGLTIRRYWQQQVDAWFKSTRRSMEDAEAKDALISGGASALTKIKAQLTVDNLGSALKRDADAEEGGVIMAVGFIRLLKEEIERIVADNEDVKLPKFMVTAE